MKFGLIILSVLCVTSALACPFIIPPARSMEVMENMIERLDRALPEMNLLKNRDTFWNDYVKSLKGFWELTGEINNTVPPPPEVRAFVATVAKHLDRALPELAHL